MKDFKHPLRTRRDFLSQGLIAFSATLSLPHLSWASMVNQTSCAPDDSGPKAMPFIVFDMAGGAALPANFLVGKVGGPEDLLVSYDKLGWNPRESGALNNDFGLPMSAKYSKLLQGILANSSAEARKNFRMASICNASQDDSSSNKLNAAALVLRAGARGSFISNGIGLVDSISGGNSSPVSSNATLKPTLVKSITDVLGATNFGGTALAKFPLEQKRLLASGAISLSQLQTQDYMNMPDGQMLADASKCSYEQSLLFLQSVAGLDPRTDTSSQAVYQITQNTDPGSANAVAAAVAMNTLKGNSGPGVWTLGGCDYHDGTQTTGDAKDLEMGVQIGKAVELAYRLKRPLFFQILTDGGVDASPGTRQWRGDSGDRSMTVIGYFNPTAAPKMIKKQVGNYTDGQIVERSTLIGNEPALAGYAVMANYLNVCGKLGDFATYAPGVFTGRGQLDSVLLFEGPA